MTQYDNQHTTDDSHIVSEKHPDPCDQASELELQRTADAIRTVQRLNKQQQVPGADGEYPAPDCKECGEEIGLGRLKVAAKNLLCIHCAAAAEHKR